jgi:hypothetical protein
MIARMQACGCLGRGGSRPSATDVFSPAVNVCGACDPEGTSCGSINPMEGGEAGFYLSHLAFAALASCASALEPCLLPCRRTTLAPCCTSTDPHGSSSAHLHHRHAAVAALDGDAGLLERAGDRWSARSERGRASHGMDRAAPERAGAQPAVQVRRQFHPLPRAEIRSAGELLHASAVLPLRRGAAQLHAERHFARGDVRWRVQRFPRDPRQLGSLGAPLPRGAAHAGYAGAEDLPRGTRRRHDNHVAEHA